MSSRFLRPKFSILGVLSFLVCTVTTQAISLPSLASINTAELRVHNNCNHPIRMAIWVYRYFNQWDVQAYERGWWDLSPGQRTRLTDDDQPIVIDTERVSSFYAESTDGSGIVWEGGGSEGSYEWHTSNLPNPITRDDGSQLRYRRANINSNGILVLTCTN
jgi:hypothetical protein